MRIIKDLTMLLTSQGILSILNLIIQIILVRVFNLLDYGTFTTLLTSITLLATINGFGISGYWLRLFSVYGDKALDSVKYVKKILIISSSLTIVIWISLFQLLNLTIPFEIYLLYIIPLLCYGLLPTVTAINQISDSVLKLSLWRTLNRIILFSTALSVLIMGTNSLNIFSIIFIILSSISLVIIIKKIISFGKGKVVLNKRYDDINPENKGSFTFKLVMFNSIPYMLLGLFYLFYYQSDLILLNIFIGAESVASYNVAFLLISVIYMILALIFNVYLLPNFHVTRNINFKNFQFKIFKLSLYCAVIGIVIIIFLIPLSDIIVKIVFGDIYQESAFLLKILAIAIPFRFVSTSLSSLLLDEKTVWSKVKIQGSAAVINLLLNILAIPLFGIMGAVVTTVITEIVVTSLYLIYARRK